jgi:hypothetical protein
MYKNQASVLLAKEQKWNKIESSKIDQDKYNQLISKAKVILWRKDILFHK